MAHEMTAAAVFCGKLGRPTGQLGALTSKKHHMCCIPSFNDADQPLDKVDEF
jgi:hypothetical protein